MEKGGGGNPPSKPAGLGFGFVHHPPEGGGPGLSTTIWPLLGHFFDFGVVLASSLDGLSTREGPPGSGRAVREGWSRDWRCSGRAGQGDKGAGKQEARKQGSTGNCPVPQVKMKNVFIDPQFFFSMALPPGAPLFTRCSSAATHCHR